jgi:hypothetical protein
VNRWPRYVVFFALCIVVLTFVFVSSGQREPRYHGQTLTYWLMKSCFERDAEATAAIRLIGTNAVPSLTRWLLYEPSKMKLKMLAANEKLPRKICDPLQDFITGDRHWKNRSDLPEYGFGLLGPEARPAIPDLVQALVRHQNRSYLLTTLLRGIGDESLPPLATLVTNRANPKELRVEGIQWILSTRIINELAVLNLEECLHDQERDVAIEAAFALAAERIEPDVIIPFLTNAVHTISSNDLDRRAVVEHLNEYGKAAQPAIPTLIELMADPSDLVRNSVTNALGNIAPEVLNQTSAASN